MHLSPCVVAWAKIMRAFSGAKNMRVCSGAKTMRACSGAVNMAYGRGRTEEPTSPHAARTAHEILSANVDALLSATRD